MTREKAQTSIVVPAEIKPDASGNRSAFRRKGVGVLLASLGVVALHLTVAASWDNTPPAPLVKQEQVVVELVKPKEPEPEVEPPKPLPQKLAPRPVPRVVPQVAKPAPAPAKIEPVAPNTPPPAVTVAAPPPAPPAPVAAPVQETVTQATGYAGYLHNPPPAYPANAQRMGLEGKVILRVRVLATGKPSNVEIQNSSGRKMLDEAAIAAVQGWMFAPARRGDTPVDGWATVPIEFKLERS
ncbi:energy transducer TonB [Janthinobacterium sp. 17J80-10]|uniref:energy transducer TonB n=1 Tax=Janthinobacterium sp. 17J80-10 TaxID=2497863 RepID=UPI00240D48C1|nr:energy transducer TonB [Janthinobacterium sp. 17J80-10]